MPRRWCRATRALFPFEHNDGAASVTKPAPDAARHVDGAADGVEPAIPPKANDNKALAGPRRIYGNKLFHNMPYATCKS